MLVLRDPRVLLVLLVLVVLLAFPVQPVQPALRAQVVRRVFPDLPVPKACAVTPDRGE